MKRNVILMMSVLGSLTMGALAEESKIALKSYDVKLDLPKEFPKSKSKFMDKARIQLNYTILLPKGLQILQSDGKLPLDAKDASGKKIKAEIDLFFIKVNDDAPYSADVSVEISDKVANGPLTIKGDIPLMVASGTKDSPAQELKTKVGSKVNVKNMKVEVEKADSVIKFSDKNTSKLLCLEYTDKLNIADISFINDDNKPIKTQCLSTFLLGSGDTAKISKVFEFPTEVPPTLKVIFSTWLGEKEIKVPINATITIDTGK